MKGCGGADKPRRAWLCRGDSWHSSGLPGAGTCEGHLRDQMSWWGISGGISQLALEPVVTFIAQSGMTELGESCQLPISLHMSGWASAAGTCASSCEKWKKKKKKRKSGAGNTENTAVPSWHQQNTGFVVSVAKHNFSWRCHRNTKHLSESMAAGALWRLEQLWRICLLLVLSNVYLKWGCIRECLLQNYKEREGKINLLLML